MYEEKQDSAEHLLPDAQSPEPPRKKDLQGAVWRSRAALLTHALFTTVWVLVSVFLYRRFLHNPTKAAMLWPSEFPFAAEAIEYNEVTFIESGLGTREHPKTPYEGPPTPEKDRLWWELSDVGIYALTPGQDEATNYPTEKAWDNDPTPLIQIEVFHQLHCLNALRTMIYNPPMIMDPAEQVQHEVHIDHCIDYLRQVLMCHGDVTPVMHRRRPTPHHPILPNWVPNFAVKHTCRNFQKIHDWAAKSNSSRLPLSRYPSSRMWEAELNIFLEDHEEDGWETILDYERENNFTADHSVLNLKDS